MGQKTTLTLAATKRESLRTTVPISMVRHYDLKVGDKLDWDFEVKEGQMVMVVRPIKSSRGNVGR